MINSASFNQLTTNNKPTRVAILDLGTNTFHLLIADLEAGRKPRLVCQETIAVKLGEGGISKGSISKAAFDRAIDALRFFKVRIDSYQPGTVKSAATSAIRSASNGSQFIEKIREETGLAAHIIDGAREAELIYLGVRAAVNMEEISLIVDIGGGSVEFIIGDRKEIFWKKSYPIGAARLMDKFHFHDPISYDGISEMHTYLNNTLTDLIEQISIYQPKLMIGSAGSFETFAELQGGDFSVSFDKPEQEIDLELFSQISDRIIRSTHAERTKMPAIPQIRVDMIVVSAILTNFIINRSGINKLKLSSYSLKEGMLFEMVK